MENESVIIQNTNPVFVSAPLFDDNKTFLDLSLLPIIAWRIVCNDDFRQAIPITVEQCPLEYPANLFPYGYYENNFIVFYADSERWNHCEDLQIKGTGIQSLIDYYESHLFIDIIKSDRAKFSNGT